MVVVAVSLDTFKAAVVIVDDVVAVALMNWRGCVE